MRERNSQRFANCDEYDDTFFKFREGKPAATDYFEYITY